MYSKAKLDGGQTVVVPTSADVSVKYRHHGNLPSHIVWDQYRKFRAEHAFKP